MSLKSFLTVMIQHDFLIVPSIMVALVTNISKAGRTSKDNAELCRPAIFVTSISAADSYHSTIRPVLWYLFVHIRVDH